jgi:AsmA protein
MQLDIAGIKVSNAQLTWRDEKAGSTTALSNLDLGSGRIRADGAQRTLAIDACRFPRRARAGADNFELKLEAPRLLVSPEKSGGETLSLSATLTGSGRNLAAKLVLSGVEGNPGTEDRQAGARTRRQGPAKRRLRGRLESPVAAISRRRPGAGEPRRQASTSPSPQMPMKQLKLPMAAANCVPTLPSKAPRWNWATQLRRIEDRAQARVAKFAPLALGFDLDIDQLNVDKYLPPKAANKPAQKAPRRDKLDFSALKGLDDRTAVIRIGALQGLEAEAGKLNATLNMAGGRLDVAPISLNLYEGSATGSLSLNASGNHLALKQNLSGISINPLMKDLADKDLLEGRGNVALDVSQPRRQRHRNEEGAGRNGLAEPQGRRDQGHQPGAEPARHQGQAGVQAGLNATGQGRRQDGFLGTHRLAEDRQWCRAQRGPRR